VGSTAVVEEVWESLKSYRWDALIRRNLIVVGQVLYYLKRNII